jgi:membrane protein DedA with SNARE-associated domain
MTELFQQLLEWVSQHPGWSGGVIFLVAMAESLAIVGLIVPGVVIMFGIGALISSGAIEFWPAMGWAVAGAISGDSFSFWLGRHYRDRLTSSWPFNRHPASLERGIAFFEKYGGKSVAIGRFFGPVRAVIPLVAGMMDMPPPRFLLANVLSALVWAPAYLLPGMVFGASLELASEVALRLVILILSLLALAWITVRLIRVVFRLLQPHTSAWIQRLLRWAELHPVMGEIATALADPNHPEARGLSILATLLLITTALFAFLLGTVPGNLFTDINQTVLQGLQSLHTPWADHLMVAITRITDTTLVYTLAVGIFGYLLWQGSRRTALYWLAAALFCIIASPLLKHGLQIPRPDIIAIPPGSYSFPSGHTLKAVVLYGFLAVILARPLDSRWRWIPYSLAGVIATSVGFSRLYLGVHWLSDVLGSLLLGLAWIAALSLAYSRHTQVESNPKGLAYAALLILGLAFSAESWINHQARFDYYQKAAHLETMEQTQWWDSAGDALPATRGDIRGSAQHPLNLQYAGSLEWLVRQMQAAGWRVAPHFSWGDLLKLLSTGLALDQLPILPHAHDGQHESLVLEKSYADGRRLVLRLWPSHVRLTPGQTTLWIGNITEQQKDRLLNLITFAETKRNFAAALQLLLQDLKAMQQGDVKQGDGRVLILARE